MIPQNGLDSNSWWVWLSLPFRKVTSKNWFLTTRCKPHASLLHPCTPICPSNVFFMQDGYRYKITLGPSRQYRRSKTVRRWWGPLGHRAISVWGDFPVSSHTEPIVGFQPPWVCGNTHWDIQDSRCFMCWDALPFPATRKGRFYYIEVFFKEHATKNATNAWWISLPARGLTSHS